MSAVLTFPRSDNALFQWSEHFLGLIQATPTDFNLVAADATAYAAVHDAFAAALTACEPEVRNKAAVVAKDAARTSLKNAATLLANKVYSSATVSDAQKVELGIPPRSAPTPVPPPSTEPVLSVVSASGWTVRIRLRDAAGARRGKPAGVAGASVFSYVGPVAPTDIGAWKFECSIGRVNKIDVQFDSTLAAGTKVWLCAFWFNGRKQSGPACAPVSTNLPGGSVSMAA